MCVVVGNCVLPLFISLSSVFLSLSLSLPALLCSIIFLSLSLCPFRYSYRVADAAFYCDELRFSKKRPLSRGYIPELSTYSELTTLWASALLQA
jgi:hypothetical protein